MVSIKIVKSTKKTKLSHIAEATTELGRGNLHPTTSKKSASPMIYAVFTLPRSVKIRLHRQVCRTAIPVVVLIFFAVQ